LVFYFQKKQLDFSFEFLIDLTNLFGSIKLELSDAVVWVNFDVVVDEEHGIG
jgi:hypothetical protein